LNIYAAKSIKIRFKNFEKNVFGIPGNENQISREGEALLSVHWKAYTINGVFTISGLIISVLIIISFYDSVFGAEHASHYKRE
jgi:hypothetical protein